MRRLVVLAAGAAILWRLISRRGRAATAQVVVGYADGSSVTLEPGSPTHDALVGAATEALQR
jgi:hypothetical protein